MVSGAVSGAVMHCFPGETAPPIRDHTCRFASGRYALCIILSIVSRSRSRSRSRLPGGLAAAGGTWWRSAGDISRKIRGRAQPLRCSPFFAFRDKGCCAAGSSSSTISIRYPAMLCTTALQRCVYAFQVLKCVYAFPDPNLLVCP